MIGSKRRTGLGLALMLALGISPTVAFAQEAPTPAPPTPPPAPPAPEVAPKPAPAAAEAEKKWYDAVNFGAFVDAYYSHNWRRPRPNAGANLYHPYTANSGFSLAWIGLDASIDPDPVGAVLQLRFGPAVPNLALGDFSIPGGIGFVQNGYVSWKPGGKDGKLTLILGKFDTVYGAEVAQSHLNINYTRGFLYNLAQPFFHTGLRADYQVNDMLQVKLLAVNGWNNTIDNNRGKSFGTQLTLTPVPEAAFSLGYMGGPEEADVVTQDCGANAYDAASRACSTTPALPGVATSGNVLNRGADSRWRHLIDVVADLKPTKDLRVMVNGDYVTMPIVDPTTGMDKTVSWFGASVLGRYQLSNVWAAGARAEVIRDKDGQITLPNTQPLTIVTGTLTLEAAPHKLLLIRLDNRMDLADEAVFAEGAGGTQKTQFTTTLGVVAKTN